MITFTLSLSTQELIIFESLNECRSKRVRLMETSTGQLGSMLNFGLLQQPKDELQSLLSYVH